MILVYHIIISGYGTWLSNDPRGSGSTETRKEDLDALAPIHHGRKRVQPSKQEVRSFFRKAEPLLDFPVLWCNEQQRNVIAHGVANTIRDNNYTFYACAVCRNHLHFVVRRHRQRDLQIRDAIANGSRDALVEENLVDPTHPVWSSRPYAVYLSTVSDVYSRVGYVEDNPPNEGLERQHWDFVQQYDGWTATKGTTYQVNET